MASRRTNPRSRRLGSAKSISYVVPLVIVIVLILAFFAGYLAGSSPSTVTSVQTSTVGTTRTVTSTVLTNATDNPECVTLHNCPSSYVYIEYGASQNSGEPGLNPANITVILGLNNTVTFQNLDTTTQILVGANNLFNSSLAPGASFNFTFTTVGTYNYASPTYAWEKGTVTVVQTTTSTSAGSNADDNY